MQVRYYLAASAAAISLAAMLPSAAVAQETTSSVRGTVESGSGAVAGATVTVLHEPSGTTSSTTTGADGSFSAQGLRIGGPFNVRVDASGFQSAQVTDVYLKAGSPFRLPITLEVENEIVVTGSSIKSSIALQTGAASVLSARDIAGVSNVNRDIRNLAARDPLVNIDPTNGGAISIAGQNNRFNRFTVDGVAFGDPFGLEAGGLVSSRGPVPLDAIEQFSVESAPIDVQQGFFQGGAINTQLKSGSNSFGGLVGFYYSDDKLRGDTARGLVRTGDFESKIYTAQITGPIIKDKLFFAVTWERLRDSVPAAISPTALGITDAQITAIQQIGQSVYNFDTLGVAASVPENDDKVVAKVDWNIANGHRAALTYIYNKGDILAGQTGSGALNATNPNFQLQSNNYTQGAVNHFGIFQLNDQWSDSFSTQLRVSYADYERLQVPFGRADFGEFRTCLAPTSSLPAVTCPSGARQLTFGPDISRQANELESQSLSVEFQASLQLNNHSLKLIAERRKQDIRNLFAQRVSGAWYFDSVADLQARRANELDVAVPLRGGIDTVTANFENNSWTFGIQDTIDVSDDLVISAGFRWDLFDSPDRPFANGDFLNRFGFSNVSTLNGRNLFQPRFGFNYTPTDRLTLRGSAGLFGGGNPNVWISNNFSNPGPTLGRVQVRRVPGAGGAADTFTISGLTGLSVAQQNTIGAATLNGVSGGTGIPQSLINAVRTTGTSTAPTNALDPNFKIPSQWRFSGSVDYKANLGFFGDDWDFGADVIWSRVKDGLTWVDLRSVAAGNLPDGRIRYAVLPGQGTTTNTDLLLTNTDQGYSWNLVGRVNKRFDNGLRLGGSYTFQRAKDLNPGTSSVAFSNYTNAATGIDSNNAAFGTSNYQRDNAFRLQLGYDAEIFGNNNTRIELFFNSQSGQRFSYTFADQASGNNRSAVFGVTGTNNRYLAYIPNVSSVTADPRVSYAPGFDFAGFQSFIQNSGLNEFQGQIAPKNSGRSPRYNKLDLSLRQEVPFVFGGKVELSMDVDNVLNLLDSDWGTIRQVAFPYYGTLVNVACTTSACTQYVYSNRVGTTFAAPTQAVQLNSSLWALRFGIRVKF
jgi:outer membrane receptor for ferrienterochelin and colicin